MDTSPRDERSEFLSFLLADEGIAEPVAVPCTSLPHVVPDPPRAHEPFPLTDVQQAYLVGRSGIFDLGQVACHSYLEIEGAFDVVRVTQVVRRLVQHHDMLRAVVSADGRQRVLAEVPPYEILVQDLTALAPEAAEAALAAVRARMSHQVLPTERWPLFEIVASRVAADLVVFHLSFDLLIGDAWSRNLLARQFGVLYNDPAATLQPSPTFRDYVLAERRLRESPLYERARTYWLGRLSTLPPGPELPLARAASEVTEPRFRRRLAGLAAGEWSRLKTRAAEYGLTPSAVLATAFVETIACWSKSERFTINTTLFHRLPLHSAVHEIVGDFTSLDLLEVNVGADVTFADRARRLQAQLWEDLDHRHFSGVSVIRELARAQHGSTRVSVPVVFTSTLGLASTDGGEPVAPIGVEARLRYGISQTPQVWLDHQVGEHAGALFFNWDAVDELFPAGLLDAMFETYRQRLARLVDEKASWDGATGSLTPPSQLEQRRRVNATAAPPSGALLHALFQGQAERRPEATAVVAEQRRLTYAELAVAARRLGRVLREAGARPNRLVAVVVPKGIDQVVAVLGILESGAAYVPIDPTLPAERVQYMLRQGLVEIAVTRSDVDAAVAWPPGVRRVQVDDERLSAVDAAPLPVVQGLDDLAYVIYTSGSTGEPKGVMIEHRGAVNTVLDINDRLRFTPDDRVLGISSLSFDLSVYDIFGVLAGGGALVLPAASAAREPAAWAADIERHGVSVWNSVPTLFEMLVEHCAYRGAPLPATLRVAMLSGDWIPVSLPARAQMARADLQLLGLGGATEASIWSIGYAIGAPDPDWRSIPYGTPLLNQTFHVLNERFEPRPVWATGQMYIGGVGLARGYWADPERTAASFVTHPESGERLYRTGDLGRYRPDGNIEFLGREDSQVKIGGYRIELGEIEAVLRRHRAVREAVVVARAEAGGARRLVAYVVTDSADAPAEALTAHLRGVLPEYMVPAAVVQLDRLPLTPNGKIDRVSLPVPEAIVRAEGGHVAPRTLTEEVVTRLCGEVLRTSPVGARDDFFDIGGDSLSAVQFMGLLRTAFQIDLPLRTIFEKRTLDAIVLELSEAWGGLETLEKVAQAWREVEALTPEQVESLGTAQKERDREIR